MSEKLKRNIIVEYLLILLVLLVGYVLLPILMDTAIGENTGLDGLGQALGLLIMVRAARGILAFLFLLVNPIRILVSYRGEFREISSKSKKYGYSALVAVPILLSVLIIFFVPISNLLYHLKYDTGRGAYSVSSEDYKSPEDFYQELSDRGLLFGEEDNELLNGLNQKFPEYRDYKNAYFYSEATMMAFGGGTFYDSVTDKDFVTPESTQKAPIYIYNAILMQPEQNGKLQFGPFARYSEQTYLNSNECPFFRDCYIECKILYVDGDLYAIIGGVENMGGQFNMARNTEKKSWVSNYPVRKVDKLDVDTINAVAEELQNGILRDAIENHWAK